MHKDFNVYHRQNFASHRWQRIQLLIVESVDDVEEEAVGVEAKAASIEPLAAATREPLSRTRLTLLTLLTPPVLVIVKARSVNTQHWSSWQSRSLKRPEWIDLVQFLGTHRPFPASASRNVTLSFFFTNDSAPNSKKKQRWLSFSKRREQRRTPRRTLKYHRHNMKTGHS